MKCNCGCLESIVYWRDNKLIEKCKTCGKEKTLRNYKKESILIRRDGYLNRDFVVYAPDSWCSNNIGILDWQIEG